MKLPVAAVTAAASTTATASAVASASATAASVASAMTSAAATTASAFTLRARFVDHESAAHELPSVESCDHFFSFGIVPNLGESETARLTRETIAKQCERIRLHSCFRK